MRGDRVPKAPDEVQDVAVASVWPWIGDPPVSVAVTESSLPFATLTWTCGSGSTSVASAPGVIVTTGGEAELGAVGGGVSPEPPEDEELCATLAPPVPPPALAATVFEPLPQAVASTTTAAAEAARRVMAGRRRFVLKGTAADVRMRHQLPEQQVHPFDLHDAVARSEVAGILEMVRISHILVF